MDSVLDASCNNKFRSRVDYVQAPCYRSEKLDLCIA